MTKVTWVFGTALLLALCAAAIFLPSLFNLTGG